MGRGPPTCTKSHTENVLARVPSLANERLKINVLCASLICDYNIIMIALLKT